MVGIKQFYEKKYKVLLFIPFIVLLIAMASIAMHVSETGDFINKGISLKGGTSITLFATDVEVEYDGEMVVRKFSQAGEEIGTILEFDTTDKEKIDAVRAQLDLKYDSYNVESFGSSLGSNFFNEIIRSMLIAFLFMGVVVFIYFRSLIPSIAIILAAFSDIVITVAIVNYMGIQLNTAGVAAFLMLIGYAVDTNILLSSKVLKKFDESTMTKVYIAMRTGVAMSLTTIAAVAVALFFSQNEIISQIMIILLIGLIVDLMNTWIQNVGLLRYHLERKGA